MIAVAALAIALTAPARDALIERWLHADRSHTIARLNSVSHAQAGEKTTRVPDLKALAADELGTRGRYQIANAPPSAGEPWWVRPWQWLHDRWQQFWRTIFARVHVGQQTAANIGDVILVLLGLLVIFVAIRLLMNLRLAREASRAYASPLENPPSPRALYKAACAAASQGDYGSAALLLFAATVALLERRGDVRTRRSATVGDLRRELRARDAALVVVFDAVAEPFVQRAYAERAVNEGQWQGARDAFNRLLSRNDRAFEA